MFCNEHHRDAYVEREQGESPNDRNDRAIRVACQWYARHLPTVQILLVTNDADNLRKAQASGLTALNLSQYIQRVSPTVGLTEEENDTLLAQLASAHQALDAAPDGKGSWTYDRYLSRDKVSAGRADGSLFKGIFQVDRDYWGQATVSIGSGVSLSRTHFLFYVLPLVHLALLSFIRMRIFLVCCLFHTVYDMCVFQGTGC